ncbi:MAG: hypothetical protein C0599_01185 [Salinivirgaceae bacterium]|nr:MAG: hypothetical protein C0599_01185 [Salinivirgaceae bacterium]
MDFLYTVYVASAIFGFGIVLIDLISAVSGATDGDDGHGDGDADAGQGDDGHFDGDDGGDIDGDSDGDFAGDHSGDHGGDDGGHHHSGESHAAHDGSYMTQTKRSSGNIVLRIIAALRTFVYFSFGFGAMGWFAVYMGKGIVVSLIWSVSVGLIITVLAKVLRKLQRNELDSQVKNEEILMATAEVTVSINKGQMGKIRIIVGSSYVDRYAKATNPALEYPKGSEVRVVDITSEYVLVE